MSDLRMPAVVKALFALELALAVMHVWDPPVPLWAERGGSTRYLWNLDSEANVPTWFSSMQLATVGLGVSGLAALGIGGRMEKRALVLAGFGFLVLSLDELISLHEKLGRGIEELTGARGTTAFDVTGQWVLVGAPLFLAAAALLWWALRGLFEGERRAGLLVSAGALLYLVSFAGIEALTNFVDAEATTVLLEEVGEMAGVTLILWGVLVLAASLAPSRISTLTERNLRKPSGPPQAGETSSPT